MENGEATVGKRISALRKSSGMTQTDLSEKLNVTYQAVSKWERDESLPDFDRLVQIAEIFNVPITYFVDGKTETQPQDNDYYINTPEPSPALIGVCKVCGKGIYDENDIAITSPALVCKACRDRKVASDIKVADEMRQKREAQEYYNKWSAKHMRNVGLITAGAICGAILILLIIGLIMDPTDIGAAIGGYCIIAFFLFPFISQLFWHGLIVDICMCGGKILGGVGVIFTLDLDGLISLILFKLMFWVLRVLFFLLTLVFFAIIAMIVSPFSFIPALVRLNRGVLPDQN